MKNKTSLRIKGLDKIIFEIFFKQDFYIETFSAEEIKLLVRIIEQIDFYSLSEEDDENEQNSK